MNIRTFALTTVFLGTLASSWAQPAPGPLEIDGRKVLTLVSNDPPGLRCNNNIQVAAELANTYKVPIPIYPVSFMPAGTKAPIVWFGGENIAQSGGKLNGMISYTELADRFEVEGVTKQDKSGLLMAPAVNGTFEALKQSIKGK
ncbi:hypothetical protein BSY239_2880 [Hydrogenophaga sp. RAC07]|mgnify:FL=1|jgi:hypothetical protein|nr:hypothetical protein BSY239_2880 [Hydrogenophaga sp. RAC07]